MLTVKKVRLEQRSAKLVEFDLAFYWEGDCLL